MKKLRAALLVPALATPSPAGPREAHAQVPTVDPSGRQPAAPAPAPAPSPSPSSAQQPVVITIGPDGQPIAPSSGDGADTSGAGMYHYDDGGQVYEDDPTVVHAGPTPELHVVRRGDTLWDICGYYFNDPWQWPKVWSFNAQITNPHWIYPGDLVRLLPKGMIANVAPLPDDVEGGPDAGQPDNFEPAPSRRTDVQLTKMGFVDQQNLDDTITIDGSVDAKELLSTGDGVYLKYPENRPPKVGQRYAIYKTDVPVQHPDSGKKVGSYVRILGELEVSDVKKDRRARAIITAANQEIERGDLVGPLERQFKTVPPVAAKVDAQGTIVAMLTGDQLVGEGAVVFVDLGEKDGLEVGNRMYVVRRGDALEEEMAPSGNIGQDDRRFPARALGQVTLVDVGKSVSIGLVTLSVEELGVGDLVMMRKSE